MKYCRVCKTRARDQDELCGKCGQPLAVLGVGPNAAGAGSPAGPTLSLEGQIQQLESARQQNLRRGKLLALVCAAILVFFGVVAYEVYSHAVLSYAMLRNVQIEQDSALDSLVKVSFEVVRPGKVAFDRRSGGGHTEKLDVFTQPGPTTLAWGWPSEKSTGIDFSVVYRGGWTRTAVDRHFAVTGKTGAVDVIFLLDTTRSMDPFIKGLKQKCIEFAGVVRQSGLNCQLGLLGFGDVDDGDPIFVFPPTADLQLFQTKVEKIPRTDGGDEPESSVEALERALGIQFRTGATVCFVHITDANCHHEQRLGELSRKLSARGVVTYVVSLRELSGKYGRLCVNGGRFFAIEEAQFDEILLKVARSITSQISSH